MVDESKRGMVWYNCGAKAAKGELGGVDEGGIVREWIIDKRKILER